VCCLYGPKESLDYPKINKKVIHDGHLRPTFILGLGLVEDQPNFLAHFNHFFHDPMDELVVHDSMDETILNHVESLDQGKPRPNSFKLA